MQVTVKNIVAHSVKNTTYSARACYKALQQHMQQDANNVQCYTNIAQLNALHAAIIAHIANNMQCVNAAKNLATIYYAHVNKTHNNYTHYYSYYNARKRSVALKFSHVLVPATVLRALVAKHAQNAKLLHITYTSNCSTILHFAY